MADFNLTSLTPMQPSQSVQQTPTVSQGSTSQTPQVPNQSPGTVLTGFIVNRDASGNPILRTENGDIPFSTNFFLKIGSEVVVRFENRGGTTQANVLSVNGQSPEVAEQQSAFTEEPEIIVSNAQEGATATQTPATQTAPTPVLNATLLPTPVSTGTATQVAQQPISLALRMIAINPAPLTTIAAPPAPAPAMPMQGTQAVAAYSRASGTPVTPQTPQAATQAPETEAVLPQQNIAQEDAAPVVTTNPNTANTVVQPLPTAAQVTPEQQTASAPQVITVSANPVPAATQSAVPAVTVQTTEQTPTAPTVLTQGQVITATVLSSDGNSALMQTPAGIVRMQTPANLPPGSSVQMEVTQVSTPDNSAPAQSGQPVVSAPLTTLARHWDSLQQIVTLLSEHAASDTAQGNLAGSINLPSLVAASIPAAAQASISPQSISAGLMFFMTALRGGDLRNWLGKSNSDWLEDQGHGDLLKRADAEFGSIARQYADTPPGQWRTLFFPVAVEGEWQQVRMFTKRDRKAPKDNSPTVKPDEDTRFVVEVSMSQMGDIQMDGLVQRQNQNVQFDLYIRSLHPILADAQKDILQIYNNIGQLTGYKGSLLFQSVKEFPVNPMEEVIAHAMKTVVA